jgi:hypothetical protein
MVHQANAPPATSNTTTAACAVRLDLSRASTRAVYGGA